MGCNIFVAHDVGLHKYWVVRISAKNPHKPPDLNRIPSKDKITKVCTYYAGRKMSHYAVGMAQPNFFVWGFCS